MRVAVCCSVSHFAVVCYSVPQLSSFPMHMCRLCIYRYEGLQVAYKHDRNTYVCIDIHICICINTQLLAHSICVRACIHIHVRHFAYASTHICDFGTVCFSVLQYVAGYCNASQRFAACVCARARFCSAEMSLYIHTHTHTHIRVSSGDVTAKS